MHFWEEWAGFFRETRRNFHDTGSLLPSSRFLGRALASEVARPRGPARILEAGPGTGAVTTQILHHLQPGDQLDLVELNPHFVDVLRRRLEQEERFRHFQDQIRIIHAPLEQVASDEPYAFIVSGLPLNNFSVALVRDIFRAYHRLLKPGGILSYFEYLWIRQVKTPFVRRAERRRLYRVGRVVGRQIDSYEVRRQQILLNVPPAVVRHLCLNSAADH
jgi:phospholipid N-methyltransferase